MALHYSMSRSDVSSTRTRMFFATLANMSHCWLCCMTLRAIAPWISRTFRNWRGFGVVILSSFYEFPVFIPPLSQNFLHIQGIHKFQKMFCLHSSKLSGISMIWVIVPGISLGIPSMSLEFLGSLMIIPSTSSGFWGISNRFRISRILFTSHTQGNMTWPERERHTQRLTNRTGETALTWATQKLRNEFPQFLHCNFCAWFGN